MKTIWARLPFVLERLSRADLRHPFDAGSARNQVREHGLEDVADVREITAGKLWDLAPFQTRGHSGHA